MFTFSQLLVYKCMKRIYKIFLICFALISGLTFVLVSCGKNLKEGHIFSSGKEVTTIFLVPMDGISQKQINQLKSDLERNFFNERKDSFIIETVDHIVTPDDCLNKAKTRLWAKSVIPFLKSNYSDMAEAKAKENAENLNMKYKKWYIIGVTNRDISTDFPGKPDFGILGLSYMPNGKVSIISSFRLKNKKELWKLAVHEFGHGYFNLPHCPEDIDTCLMQDAKHGNPHFELKEVFCEHCSEKSNP